MSKHQNQNDLVASDPLDELKPFDLGPTAATPAPVDGGSIELTDDGPEDDRSELAIKNRFRAVEGDFALDWLDSQPGGDAENTAPDVAAPEVSKTDNTSVIGDIGQGLVEAPRAIATGVQAAFQEAVDLYNAADSFIAENIINTGQVQIFKDGAFDLKLIPPGEVDTSKPGLQLPKLMDDPKSTTGKAIKSITQFLTGFAAGGVVLKSVKAIGTLAKIVKASAQGAIADFTVFDEHEKRLSDMLQEVPELKNPVTEYLASNEDDSVLEGRFKNAVEGVLAGAVFDGVFAGLKAIRASRRAKLQSGQGAADASTGARPEDVVREAGPVNALGDATEGAPLVSVKAKPKADKGAEKQARAAKETEIPVPPEVAAKAVANAGTVDAGGKEIFINFARIETGEDIQAVMSQVADAFSGSVNKAKRGVQSNKTTEALADEVNAWEVLSSRRKGEPLNAEQSVAARRLWVASGEKLFAVAEEAAKNPSTENLFQFRKMLSVFHGVQKEVVAARTETARALQSWKIPVGADKTSLLAMEQALAVHGGNEVSQALAKSLTLAGRSENPMMQALAIAERGTFAKTLSTVQEYWINALLSGPKTQMVNIMSNISVIGLSVVERAAASRISRTFETESGVEVGEAMAQTFGLMSGITDAFRNAGKSFRTGETGFGVNKVEFARERQISSTTWNLRSDSWVGKGIDTLGALTNVPVRSLAAADEFFKTLGYRMELQAQAHRMAIRDLRQGVISKDQVKERIASIVEKPPEALELEAAYVASYQTFTNTNTGKLAQGMRGMLEKRPILRFVLPFLNTPANILSYTFDRTPLAPLTSRYRAAIRKGGAEADLVEARMALGTMLIMASIDMAQSGVITGSGPERGQQQQNWRRQGNQRYSLKVGDKFIAFNRLDPIGFLLGMGADIGEYVAAAEADDLSKDEVGELMATAVFSIAENIVSKNYLRGVSDLISAIKNPDRNAEYFLNSFASSFVPAIVGEVARFRDPTQRAAHDIVTSFKRRLPVFSETLPPRRDLWGRELEYGKGFSAAYNAVSPLYGSILKPEPIDTEMQNEGFFIGMPQRSVTIDGKKTSFRNRPDIYSRYVQLQGATKPEDMGGAGAGLIERYGNDTLLETLNQIVTGKHFLSVDYEQLSEVDDKDDFLTGIVKKYRRAAKQVLRQEFPELENTDAITPDNAQ